MAYTVTVEFAPAYELVVSLVAFSMKPAPKSLYLGKRWTDEVGSSLPPGAIADDLPLSELLAIIHDCPGERDARGFIAWLDSLGPRSFAGLLSSQLPPGHKLSQRLEDSHGPLVAALSVWEERYFSKLDPALLAGLIAEAEVMAAVGGITPPVELVEMATGGVDLQPRPGLERVLLAPQYHFRPVNLYEHFKTVYVYAYPTDVVPAEAGAPPEALTRLTAALADASRLRILRFLAAAPRTFTDVKREIGLAKSTVHHHLVTLRSAGLLRVHDLGEDGVRYSLRPAALSLLGARLGAYIEER